MGKKEVAIFFLLSPLLYPPSFLLPLVIPPGEDYY